MIDKTLRMKDAGAVTTSAAATVASAARIVDVGSGLVDGLLVADVSAIVIDEADQAYTIQVQGSDVADFTTGSPKVEVLAEMKLGEATALTGNQDSAPGRFTIPFRNEKAGAIFPYLRVYTVVAGSESPSINYTAHIQSRP